MSGEHDLTTLLRSMKPTLIDGIFVFAHVPDVDTAAGLEPIMMFREAEAVTVILPQEVALAARLPAEFPCRMITLNVHSALDAVGFLAKVSTHLAALGMGVNPVSGFYHDHLFIPEDRAYDAMDALEALSAGAAGS